MSLAYINVRLRAAHFLLQPWLFMSFVSRPCWHYVCADSLWQIWTDLGCMMPRCGRRDARASTPCAFRRVGSSRKHRLDRYCRRDTWFKEHCCRGNCSQTFLAIIACPCSAPPSEAPAHATGKAGLNQRVPDRRSIVAFAFFSWPPFGFYARR